MDGIYLWIFVRTPFRVVIDRYIDYVGTNKICIRTRRDAAEDLTLQEMVPLIFS